MREVVDGMNTLNLIRQFRSCTLGRCAGSVEYVVALLYNRFSGLTGALSHAAKDVREHEQAVGGVTGLEFLLETVFRHGGRFHVAQLSHISAPSVEHLHHVNMIASLDIALIISCVISISLTSRASKRCPRFGHASLEVRHENAD